MQTADQSVLRVFGAITETPSAMVYARLLSPPTPKGTPTPPHRQNVAMTAPAIIGLGHLDLTVTDGDRAMRWWEQVMGFKLLAKWEQPGYRGWTMVHPSGLGVTAVTHDEGDAGAFDERRVGLDHVAFRVSDLAALEAWASRLDALG